MIQLKATNYPSFAEGVSGSIPVAPIEAQIHHTLSGRPLCYVLGFATQGLFIYSEV